jgi:hypothetical protein
MPPQQWAGVDQMPTQRTTVPGRTQGGTQFPMSPGAAQIRPETAEQRQVCGREWFRGKVFHAFGHPWSLMPPLAKHAHVLIPVNRPLTSTACGRISS